MSTFHVWTDDELVRLQRLAQEAGDAPDWKVIARALGTGRSASAVAARYRKPIMVEPVEYRRSSAVPQSSWSIKAAPALPQVGTDVLIRCEGDVEMGGVTHQVARVLAVLKGGIKVHWHGWSELHQQDDDAIVLASSGRLLGWNTQRHLALAAQHVREITAIDEGPAEEQYQMPDPDQYVVRTLKGFSGIAKVRDRAIRQMGQDSAFEVAWLLDFENPKHKVHNGYVAAMECELAVAPTLATDGSAVQIDLSERFNATQTLALMRHGDSIWVALSDLLLLLDRKIPVSKLPRPLTARLKDRKFTLRSEKPRKGTALPLQLYKSFIECLPRDVAAAFRLRSSPEKASDAEWLLKKIHAKLQEARLAPPEDERLLLPSRDDDVVYADGADDRRVHVRVRIRPGKQPLLSGIDLVALIEHKPRNVSASRVLMMKTLSRFVSPHPIKFSGQSASNSLPEPTIPADCLDLMLDCAIARLPDDKTGRRAAFGHFRDTSEYHWLREVIHDLTDPDAETTVLPPEVDEEFDSERSESESEDGIYIGEMWRPVEWKDIKPAPPCPVALDQPHWTPEAESCIPAGIADRKNARAGDFYYHSMSVNKEERDKIDRTEIEDVLTRTSKPVSYRVGVAEILDPENHVLQAARKNDYQGPVYLAYAKRRMRAYTILGEYTGRVVTDRTATAEEEKRKQELAETSSMEAAVHGEVFSKYSYDSTFGKKWKEPLVIDTSHAANELSILNDYRLDVTAGPEGARKQRNRKQHLQNVTFIEVVDKAFGRPHLLFVLTRDVEKGEELLVDYGDVFWENYLANCRWMVALRHARSAGLAAGKEEVATQLLAEQAARKLAEQSEATALKKVKMLEQQLASRANAVISAKRGKRGSPTPPVGDVNSPPVCPLSEPSGASRRTKRKRPTGFKTGEILKCPECSEWIKVPKSTPSVASCRYCMPEIHSDDRSTDDKHANESDEGDEGRARAPGVAAKRARRGQRRAEKVFNYEVGTVGGCFETNACNLLARN
jgi:hypothetical protein